MPFSDTNRTALRFVEETAWGTTPAGPNMQALNFTSESLKSSIQTVTSETIRDDRNVSDIVQVGGGAAGDVGFELRYADAVEELIAGAMQAAWVTTTVSAAVASARFSSTHVQADSSALNAIVSGQLIRTTGATTGANDGDWIVTAVSVAGASARVHLADASTGVAASFTSEVFAAGTRFLGRNIRNGTTAKSYTLEKVHQDVSVAAQYTGMRVAMMGFSLESQAILNGTFAFSGKGQTVSTLSIASAVTSATTANVMNASGNVGRLWEGSNAVTGISFQSISLDLNNNPREQPKVGSDVLAGISTGRCEVTGSFTAYLEDKSLIDKYVDGTKTSLRFQVTDADGNSYVITVPRVTITDQTVVAGGPNADVVQEMTWAAAVDVTGTYAIQIDALDA